MSDSVITIRMPKSLAIELKKLTVKNHYLDISEQIRDVLRSKSLEKLREYTAATSQREKNTTRDKKLEQIQKMLLELKDD